MISDFLKDERARIPFSVVGIFLILGSSFTTVYVAKLEQQKSQEMISAMDFSEVENILHYAEADIANMLNLVGVKALKEIGANPVMTNFNQSVGYDITNDKTFNRDRALDIITRELNIYLKTNYLYDYFNNGRYAANVILAGDTKEPVSDWSDVGVDELKMKISRTFNLPLVGADDREYSTYWTVSVPVTFEVKDLEDGREIFTKRTEISTIITSRYPLLRELVTDYEKRANGINSLMVETTALSNIYSLIRGVMHWQTLKPGNVVDNKHLAIIVNGCTLLEQGMVFNSVDPASLVDYVYHSYKTLTSDDDGTEPIDIMNSSALKNDDELSVDPSEIADKSVKSDSGNSNLTVDFGPDINLIGIAEKPLYNWTSVILNFVDSIGNPLSVELLNPSEDDISNAVEHYIALGYNFVSIEKGTFEQNQTTENKIDDVALIVYSADLKTNVERDPDPVITYGDHTGYPIDNGTEPWSFDFYVFKDTIDKPSKGSVVPGCTLYGKIYDVHWNRQHYWSKKTVETSGNNTWVNWTHFTAIDYKLEEDVTIGIILNHYSDYRGTKDDVKDVFYKNDSLDDENLEDTIQKYRDIYFDPNLDDLIKTGAGASNAKVVTGDVPTWVATESWNALESIFEQIRQIKLDESINYVGYPNPVDLIREAKNDLLGKFNDNITIYLDQESYVDGSYYKSVGKKTVFFAREWYVDWVKENIEVIFSAVENKYSEEMQSKLNDYFGSDSTDARSSLNKAQDLLSNQLAIPFGFDMELNRIVDDNELWNEKIRLAVDQIPNYLDPYEKTEYEDELFWSLKLKNVCTLGPTGIPILPPTPVTPWIFTMNIWYIEVAGEYGMFKVMDTLDENIPNPLFGHEPQIYVRENKAVYDDQGRYLGNNTRLSFGFSTVALAFVPPWGMMVGDTQGDIWNDHTAGYD